jgi:hypothetical protein
MKAHRLRLRHSTALRPCGTTAFEAGPTFDMCHDDLRKSCARPYQTHVAAAAAAAAAGCRYGVQRGPEGQALLARLISARRRQLLGASLARKMSVLAWEAATAR